MTAENDRELTVEEAAQALAVSVATIRRYCRQEKLTARKVPSEGQQDAWAITVESVQALAEKKSARRKRSRQAAGSEQAALTVMNATLRSIDARLQAQQKALLPSEDEQRARDEQARRLEEALTGQTDTIRRQAEEIGALRAERDRLRDELEAERGRAWWMKILPGVARRSE